jgi:hypothetical protein
VKSEGPAKETEAPSTANVVKALKTPSTSESTPSASSRTEPIVQNPTLADIAPAVDTTSQSISDDAKAKGTARFRRDPITSKKMRGTLVAEFPQRLVIQYKGSSGRDPFETLIDEEKQYNVPIEKRVPNVEGLSLVGVIESGWGDDPVMAISCSRATKCRRDMCCASRKTAFISSCSNTAGAAQSPLH